MAAPESDEPNGGNGPARRDVQGAKELERWTRASAASRPASIRGPARSTAAARAPAAAATTKRIMTRIRSRAEATCRWAGHARRRRAPTDRSIRTRESEMGGKGHPLPASHEARHGEIPEQIEAEKGLGDDPAAVVQPAGEAVNPDGERYRYDDNGRAEEIEEER